ncbi:MAG TPA: hypothetical protein DIT04_10440, partial [Dysgonomonas sp.]|nr:hypothetical protein [Dysgonomonas sp.]
DNRLLSSFKQAVKYWWVSLLVGVIAVILGIVCLFTPFATFTALTFLFIFAFLMGGIAEIVFALANKNSIHNWGWTLAVGIIDIVFAIILLMNLELAPLMLAYLIAFWIMLQSFWGIGMAFDLQSVRGSGWGWLLALSIMGVIASILLLFQPAVAGLFAAYIVAFGFLFYGIFRIYLAFRLKNIHNHLSDNDLY